MAILLMALMIAPFGICLPQHANGAHSCCMQMETPHSVRTNCCVARPQLPATLAASAVPNSSPSETVHAYAVCVEAMATSKHPAIAIIPHLSPPTGAIILRI
jgi:hypothetical protein